MPLRPRPKFSILLSKMSMLIGICKEGVILKTDLPIIFGLAAIIAICGCIGGDKDSPSASIEKSVSEEPINETLGPYAISIKANGFSVTEINTTTGNPYYLTLTEAGKKNWLAIGLKETIRPDESGERYSSLISSLSNMAYNIGLFKSGLVRNWVQRVDIQGNEAYMGSRNKKGEEVEYTIVAYYPLNDTMLTAVGYFPDESNNVFSEKSEKRIQDTLNHTYVRRIQD